MRGVVLMSIALFGWMWVFQIYTSFLPEFFRLYRGLGLEEASTLTGVLPLTGIFAAGWGGRPLACGTTQTVFVAVGSTVGSRIPDGDSLSGHPAKFRADRRGVSHG
jgi:hypothetical protein